MSEVKELNKQENKQCCKSNHENTSCCSDSKHAETSTPEDIKQVVRERYSSVITTRSCGCSSDKKLSNSLVEGYDKLEGYNKSADYGLGCGIPTEFANIQIGDTVLDLGSGAGNDVFVARAIVGEEGRVFGIDFTDEMIKKANENLVKTGFTNVEFRKGDIENMPIEDSSIDVVISNCVINLVPNKKKAFAEIYRVLKPSGHFCISDMVVNGSMKESLRKDLELYAGCVAGAVSQDEYLNMLHEIGFTNPEIKKSRQVITARERLDAKYSAEKAEAMWSLAEKLFSITFYAEK